jgi:hypothetical protein
MEWFDLINSASIRAISGKTPAFLAIKWPRLGRLRLLISREVISKFKMRRAFQFRDSF